MDTDACFHTFMLPTYRPYKVIIRNLHHTTLICDISDKLGHLVWWRVTNVIKNGNPCPLFLKELNLNTNNKEILNLSSILHIKIKDYRSVETARTTFTLQTITTILYVVSSLGMTTPMPLTPRKKTAQPNAPFAWAIIRPTTEDAHHSKHFSNVAKGLIQNRKIRIMYSRFIILKLTFPKFLSPLLTIQIISHYLVATLVIFRWLNLYLYFPH